MTQEDDEKPDEEQAVREILQALYSAWLREKPKMRNRLVGAISPITDDEIADSLVELNMAELIKPHIKDRKDRAGLEMGLMVKDVGIEMVEKPLGAAAIQIWNNLKKRLRKLKQEEHKVE